MFHSHDKTLALLHGEQAARCGYRTRHGDGRTCDCKYGLAEVAGTRTAGGERTGCPEFRSAIVAVELLRDVHEKKRAVIDVGPASIARRALIELRARQQVAIAKIEVEIAKQSSALLAAHDGDTSVRSRANRRTRLSVKCEQRDRLAAEVRAIDEIIGAPSTTETLSQRGG